MLSTRESDPLLVPEDLIPDVRLASMEQDAFGHQEIAGRVAEVAGCAEAPTNIALFGAWGSGKSSFYELLKLRLKQRHPEVGTVRYDAWKFGGASLKRNFLSHAASELGIKDKGDGRKFYGGLYENTRTFDFDPLLLFNRERLTALAQVVLFALLGAALAIVALSWLSVLITDADFSSEVQRLGPQILAMLGPFLVAIGAAVKILDGMRVEIEQAVPSEDEQFENLFKELVKEATSPKLIRQRMRLLFFIDELDRCDKRDVVATLESLRTFLDHPRCVFVVAADREVLEAALTAAHQSTPVNEEEPYYSSASAYLDKIFQHQFTLPPLRGGRLTGFARELVLEREGLWAQLRETQPNERLLNDVVYALIPAHVRSPRRVKVLLNNYATTIRVSQARGIEWLPRATEIAKLVVLLTEFPSLAADLHIEPRLPTWLLHPPTQLSARQQQLLNKHRLDVPIADPSETPEPATHDDELKKSSPPDPLLAGMDNPVLRNRQRDNLFRYLESRAAAGVPDPGRDLLHMESAGYVTGIEDPELAQLIEARAANEPGDVITALEGQPPTIRIQAARLVGEMSEREFGPERKNMITAITGILERMAPDEIKGSLGDLLRNVQSYRSQEPLTLQQTPGALVLAIADPGGRELRREILDRDDLIAQPGSLARVAQLLPSLDDSEAVSVEKAVAKHTAAEPEIILNCLGSHPSATVARLISVGHSELVSAVKPPADSPNSGPSAGTEPPSSEENTDIFKDSVDSPGEAAMLVGQLFSTLQERGSDFAQIEAELLTILFRARMGPLYETLRDLGDNLQDRLEDRKAANSLGLAAIRACPAEDWSRWLRWLTAEPDREGPAKKNALGVVVSKYPSASPEDREVACDVVAAMAEIAGAPFQQPEKVVANAKTALGAAEWWASDEASSLQGMTYKFLNNLRKAAPDVDKELEKLINDDVRRLSQATWDLPLVARLKGVVVLLEPNLTVSLDEVVRGVEEAAAANPATTAARIATVSTLRNAGLSATAPSARDVIQLAAEGSRTSDQGVADWLELDPPSADVMGVLAARGRAAKLEQPVKEWSLRQGDSLDAAFLLEAFDNSSLRQEWFKFFEVSAPARSNALQGLSDRMAQATNPDQRRRVVEALNAVPLDTPTNRKTVAQMALDLLTDKPSKTKSDTASRLVEVAGSEYGLKRRIQEAAREAVANEHVDKSTHARFERADILKKQRKGLGKLLQRD